MTRSPWKTFAKGRAGRTLPGQMNRMETAYAELLELRRRADEIEWYAYEGITFRLTHSDHGRPGQTYTPDFSVMLPDGQLEFHEVKGFQDMKNINKIKVAADKFPVRFIMVQRRRKKDGGGWTIEEFGQ